MKLVWVLAVVTLVGVEEFEVESFGAFDDFEQCHSAALKIFWHDMPVHREPVCLAMEIEGNYWE